MRAAAQSQPRQRVQGTVSLRAWVAATCAQGLSGHGNCKMPNFLQKEQKPLSEEGLLEEGGTLSVAFPMCSGVPAQTYRLPPVTLHCGGGGRGQTNTQVVGRSRPAGGGGMFSDGQGCFLDYRCRNLSWIKEPR